MIKRKYAAFRNTVAGIFEAVFSLVAILFVPGVIVAVILGWVLNILEIVATPLVPLTTMLILRLVGIFVFPLGSVLGLFA